MVGVHEYDVDAEGNTVAKIWEWKQAHELS
jgi:hypothetical protein